MDFSTSATVITTASKSLTKKVRSLLHTYKYGNIRNIKLLAAVHGLLMHGVRWNEYALHAGELVKTMGGQKDSTEDGQVGVSSPYPSSPISRSAWFA